VVAITGITGHFHRNTHLTTTHHENIIAWSREWHLEKTGKDINPEQCAVLLHTIRERANVKPSKEEQQAVRMLALKQGNTPLAISNSLEARVKCAELVGTDRREQWGELAVEIQHRLEAAKAVAQERKAQETRLAAFAAARFKEALPKTPPTVGCLTPATIKQVIELLPQCETKISVKYAQPISFVEEQCRKAGDVPTLESRKALVAILAVHDVMKPTEQTLKAYNHLLEAKGEKLSLPLNELSALTKVNSAAAKDVPHASSSQVGHSPHP